MITFANILRGGAVVARRAHNPKVRGSSPLPATRIKDDFFRSSFLFTITPERVLNPSMLQTKFQSNYFFIFVL